MNSSIGFSGSGDVNGYDVSMLVTAADQFGGMSSASITVDLGDMGKLSFDQGVGIGGISTIDDKTPSAYEEVWDGLDAVTGDKNGLVGGGNSGVFVYANTIMGSSLSAQVSKGGSAANTDDATTEGVSGNSWDFALTNDTLAPGMNAGIGYGQIANANQNTAGGGDDTDEHMTAFVTYTVSGISLGYQVANRQDNTDGGAHEEVRSLGAQIGVLEAGL